MSILATERATYQDVWSSVDEYKGSSPGEQFLPIFLSHTGPDGKGRTVLDVGAGSGNGSVALVEAGFQVRMLDITDAGLVPEARGIPYADACLWHDLSPVARAFGHPNRTRADYVYCCDVLEHVPEQFTMLAIDQMLRVAKHGLFLSVSLRPDVWGVWVGKALHQTVKPFTWWRDSLKELGAVVEARDLLESAVFFVAPKGAA
jgi:2-polyprenyl-3-methyl-5-hydroxy-6-metoxy-1,4-benzoquinol methylase